MTRELLSAMWSAISVTIIAGLAWFLWLTRHDSKRQSGVAALGINSIFFGLLFAQFYNWLMVSWLGVAAAILAIGGGATVAWSFRPQAVNGVLWMGGMVFLALLIALVRLYPVLD